MKLYHVSYLNRNLQVIDMSKTYKRDVEYTGKLIEKANSFQEFQREYLSPQIQECAQKKGWIKEKIATEAIFEFIRQNGFYEKPSRLQSTYFTNSLESANNFNRTQRNGQGVIFMFEADNNNIFCFDMDIFDRACRCFERHGMKEEVFEQVKKLALEYWWGYEYVNDKNCEILYRGTPILYRYDM